MFDVKAIRDDRAVFDRGWRARGLDPLPTDAILDADARLRAAKAAFETAQARRNEASKLIGAAKKAEEGRGPRGRADGRGRGAEGASSQGLPARPRRLPPMTTCGRLLSGHSEHTRRRGAGGRRRARATWSRRTAALAIHRQASRRRTERRPRTTWSSARRLGMMDFEAAARMSGARFVVLRKRDLARLERALGQFMLDHANPRARVRGGVAAVACLALIRLCLGTGQLPKFSEDLLFGAGGVIPYSPRSDAVVDLVAQFTTQQTVCRSTHRASDAGAGGHCGPADCEGAFSAESSLSS